MTSASLSSIVPMASSSSDTIIEVTGDIGNSDLKGKLQKAIRRNEWYNLINLIKLLQEHPEARTLPITDDGETALILAAKQGKKSNLILETLLENIPTNELTQSDCRGNTALHAAAVVGNVDGAMELVSKNRHLANISNHDGHLPSHVAVTHVHRDLMLFLLDVTPHDVEPNPFVGQPGAKLMCSLISSGFYDVALQQIQRYPRSAWDPDFSPLKAIAQEPTAFRSGVKLGFWKRVIYTWFPPNFMQQNKQEGVFVCRRFFSKVLDIIVPQLKNIRRMKESHLQAMELLRSLFKTEVVHFSSSETLELICRSSFILAAQYGISEVVEEILKSFPGEIIKSIDEDRRSAFHLAVMYRHENVFNVLNDLSGESFGYLSTWLDINGNNILHLAGYRAQQYQIDVVSSAVLQMQRELKWFQEVERLVPPEQKKQKNGEKMTPLEVFQEEHKDMEVYEGQWMIGMANSCTVATTIIGTIAFAAAITVPGGNKGDGSPTFSGGVAFIIFAISNALALFSSICTLLIFLSILTSRYATIDYLYTLPNRLIMGLVALFFSITSMIISFSATLYIVFAHNNNRILIPIVALALLPVALFVILQFPLLQNMMQSTYGRSIFRPKKEEKPPTNISEIIEIISGLCFDILFMFISCFDGLMTYCCKIRWQGSQ